MAQISKGDTFVDGQQVTGARLNQLVDSSVLLVGAITDQPNITANTLEATDSTIVNDAGVLKEATIGDILNSGLDTTFDVCTNETTVTSALNGKTNKDINVTPNDGVLVTGKSFTSVDGITATVTSIAHGLENNTCLNISASNAVYSGQYFITVINVDSFSYVISQTTPVAASGTLDYTKKGTVKVVGSEHLSGNLEVVGKTEFKSATKIAGNLNVAGTTTLNSAPLVLTSVINPRFDYFVQTRANAVYTSGWGGNQNTSNLNGVKIPELDITFTPQKAGNKVVLTWTIFGECTNSAYAIFLVTRTPNSGAGAGVAVALPDAVDATNNTWSGVSSFYDGNDDSTPNSFTIKIVDNNTLSVPCTYSVHFRASANFSVSFFLNRSATSAGGLAYETGMSLGHAQEIYT